MWSSMPTGTQNEATTESTVFSGFVECVNNKLFKPCGRYTMAVWQCLHSRRTAGVSFDNSHQGQMGQESFLCSHFPGLVHPVQDMWGNSQPWLGFARTLSQLSLTALEHVSRKCKTLPWVNTGIFLPGAHLPQK